MYKAIRKNRTHDGLKRIIISKMYNLFFEIFFHTGVKDINASPKILKRGIYEKLAIESDDWFIDAEIVIKTARIGGKIGEMEIEYLPRLKGKSKVKMIHIYQFFKNMLIWRKKIKYGKFLEK